MITASVPSARKREKRVKLIHIVGCRPNFIKLAPVYRAAKDRFEQVIIHTGQHYDKNMSDIFFEELEIPRPDGMVIIGGARRTGDDITDLMLYYVRSYLKEHDRDDIVVVYGDTNSTLAGALAAKKLGFRVAHVEAGIRSFDRNMPEEVNRKIVDHISDYLFAPSEMAMMYLKKEGLHNGLVSCWNTGDVMYDQFLWAQDKLKPYDEMVDFILVTIHREENTTGIWFKEIESKIEHLKRTIFWPRHPRTGESSPISYIDLLSILKRADLVITDSGGVQKEAFWSKIPCITLRDRTEWPETIHEGWNCLCEPDNLPELVKNYKKRRRYTAPNPYGNGKAAEKIVDLLT